MSFDSIARNYLSDLHTWYQAAKRSNEFTEELSFRPVLDRFFRDVAKEINSEAEVVFEPKAQKKAGRPDWRFHNEKTLGVYGYVEAKGLDIDRPIVIADYQTQIEKYLTLGYGTILTDGIDFIFFSRTKNEYTRISIIDKPVTVSGWRHRSVNPLLEGAFKDFLKDAVARQVSENQLVEEVAKRARKLSENVEYLSDLPLGSGVDRVENATIEALHKLKEIVESHHDPTLRNRKSFGDFVAQVLMFGLLYAHRIVAGPGDSPQERYHKIQKFWSDVLYQEYTEKLRPFRALVEILSEELETLGPLGTWYQDCCLLLAHIELEDGQMRSPDYHKLYESFLSVFDPKTRFDYGAFYTPRELSSYTIALVRAVVASEFNGMSLYLPDNKTIDPCCGTGTFLEELIAQRDSDTLPYIIGFEILPAPYALAHYRLSMLDAYKKNPEKISVILTNTLSDELENEELETKTISVNLIEEEQRAARYFSKPPLTLIIGNPPSSDLPVKGRMGNFDLIQNLLKDFRPPEEFRTARQNTQKQIQNDFIMFLRWSCEKLLQSDRGIFALVLPMSFAEHPSYMYARKWIASRFPKLWILDLDLDGRTGTRGSSLFNTMQGRLLMVGMIDKERHEIREPEIHYRSITDLNKEDKLTALNCGAINENCLDEFEKLSLDPETFGFRPAKPFNRDLYNSYWPLFTQTISPLFPDKYIFSRHCSGLKLAPTSLFVHVARPMLVRRSREIADLKNDPETLLHRWFSGQDKPPDKEKLSPNIRRILQSAAQSKPENEFVRSYDYRPFLTMSALISEAVLQELSITGGGGTRHRPEVIAAFSVPETVGIAVSPAPKDIGDELHRFVSFCWNLPDNDLSRRGNAHVFCNLFPENKGKGKWDRTPINNISQSLLTMLENAGISASPEAVVFYVYGVLCSDAYLDEFEGALFTVADLTKGGPRIPITKDPQTFYEIAQMGEQLALLEKHDLVFPIADQFASYIELFNNQASFELTRFDIDEAGEKIILKDERSLIEIILQPIPTEILTFQVSGYQVLQQWLKFHSHRYTRMTFSQEDYEQLLRLLTRIDAQIRIVKNLDDVVVGVTYFL